MPCTPSMLAATMLDRVEQGEVENLVVSVKNREGKFNVFCSTMKTTDMLMHERMVKDLAEDLWSGNG